MSAERPNHASSSASVLVVGLTNDVVARVSKIVAPHGMQARTTTIAKLREDTSMFKPIVVLVDQYLYDFDPKAFDKLAVEIGAKLGIVGNVRDAEALLERMLRTAKSSDPGIKAQPKPTSKSQEFQTAKYDAKTLQDALERMTPKRAAEFETAKYDAKTLHEALERMSTKRSERETSEYDAKTLSAILDAEDARRAQRSAASETVRYDAETLEAMLDEVTARRAAAEKNRPETKPERKK